MSKLARDRDQLLAEACQCEFGRHLIVLPKDFRAAAGEEQEQRREADPWGVTSVPLKGAP